MSLNGLDNPTVIEAYQTALNEAGGWFLLRYVSRDEVALLDRGAGGVPDIRNAIDNYEECSPLYGFLQYRRRKVVLSYLPEDLSRLVRARTTVQFQSVLDKFSPHDTVFSLSQPTELTESALSSACLLHTASGSITSSSSSLRRRRLMEIAEDAEENPAVKDGVQVEPSTKDMRQRSFSQLSEATVVPTPSVISNIHQTTNGDETTPMTPDSAQPNGRTPSILGDTVSERPTSSRNFRDELTYAPSESRKSTQSARPSLRDLERATGFKPKVKLGPRPSVDGTGRPRTAGNISRTTEQRPVASLPAGIRSSSLRKSNPSPTRPRSQGNPVASLSSRKVPPVPPLLVPPLSMPISRPQLSPGAKSLSALSSVGTSHEKERLMKALQMRKSQMEKRAQELKGAREKKKSTMDLTEDKENIGEARAKPKHDKGRDRLSKISEQGKEPLSETQPSEPIEAQDRGGDEPPSNSKMDSVVDTVITEPNDDKPVDSSASDAVPEPIDTLEQLEEVKAAPIISEPEEPKEDPTQEDLAVSTGSKANSGTGSPSAVFHVPLEGHPETTEEIAATPPHQIEELPALDEKEVGATAESAEPVEPQPVTLTKSPSPNSQANSSTESSTITATHTPAPQHDLTPKPLSTEQESATPRKENRRVFLEPIQVPTPEYSDDDNLLSDDSFMEELKSATVQEAKPISVGKSPLSPGYSNGGNGKTTPDAWRNSRAVSNPSAIGRQFSNNHGVAVRSISGPFTEAENSTGGPVLVAKKINVSSGISKRIKALEKFSSTRDAAGNQTQAVATPSASSFETLRKRASVSLGAGNADMASMSRPSSYVPETFSRASSIRGRDSQSSTIAPRATNTVSVTAHIVRDQNPVGADSTIDLSESRGLNLQASPLTVEHGTSDTPTSQSPPAETPAAHKPGKRSMSTSSTTSAHRPSATPIPRSESRLSLSSISRNDGVLLPRSPSDMSSSPEERKESRTSRLLRRMSSITSSSRRGTVSSKSPVVMVEENMSPVEEGPKQAIELPEAVDIGEVNVQFPDTLLWKRRFIRVDNKGYLVLTPGNIDSSNRNMVKRYHLTDFKTPCLPDEDRQELPNSILLDFLDGSTLQCACESRQGQAFVLQTLVNAHSTYKQILSQ